MRVLQAYKVYRPDVDGGIPEVIAQLSELRSQDDEVAILVARDKGRFRRFVHDGTPVTAVSSFGQLMSMPIAPSFPFELRRELHRFDVLAAHAPFPLNDLGLALGVPDHVALVVHWHAEIVGRGLAKTVLEPFMKQTLQRADRIIVSAEPMIAGSPLLHKHAGKCVVIPYGIDVEYWSRLDNQQRRQAEAITKRCPRLIVSVGRLVPYKGYPFLLEAMKAVDGELVIIGEGVERERLWNLAKALGVADRVTLKGFVERDEIKQILHAARLFVLPSVSSAEAFGIVQIEAMAAGLPVVNTWLPTAVPIIARDGIEGLTVKPGDAGALARAINNVLNDETVASRMAAAARTRSAEEFSRAAFLTRVRKVYQDACDERRNGRAGNGQ